MLREYYCTVFHVDTYDCLLLVNGHLILYEVSVFWPLQKLDFKKVHPRWLSSDEHKWQVESHYQYIIKIEYAILILHILVSNRKETAANTFKRSTLKQS